MKLRSQLLLAGALTLLLPLVAYRSVLQMDEALRDSRAFEVTKTTKSIRSLLRHSGTLPSQSGAVLQIDANDLYAELVTHKMVLDGYGDDWANQRLPQRHFANAGSENQNTSPDNKRPATVDLRLAASQHHLHMLLKVQDTSVRFHKPVNPIVASEFAISAEPPETETIASGDHVIIFTEDIHGQVVETVFRVVAPGPVVGRRYGRERDGIRPIRKIQRYRGHWVATGGGYQLELRLPLPDVNSKFGIAVVDIDGRGAATARGRAQRIAGKII